MTIRVLNIDEESADFLRDESRREGYAEKIAFPRSTDEVVEAVQLAAQNQWPVTVQGGRTGITGGCVPSGGLILNLSRMNTVGAIEQDRLRVQPGATLVSIRTELKGSGLFFPSDLTETTATLGGMVANNASGARSFQYGAVRDWIVALEVVLANGEVVQLERGRDRADGRAFTLGTFSGGLPSVERPAVKNAAGYYVVPDMDLVDLFIGAEGTLGVVTQITIQLLPDVNEVQGLTAFFASEPQALAFVRFLREWPGLTRPMAIEYFDVRSLELLRRMRVEYAAFGDLPEVKADYGCAIYFEFCGAVPDAVLERAGAAVDCWVAAGDHEIERLKNFRHAIPEAVNLLIGERKKEIPELTKLGTDMAVPDDQLERVMQLYHAGLDAAGLEYVIFGHIGNNHVHVNILPRSMEEYEQGKMLYLNWARQVVAMGGSVSAEHGIGKIKTEFLQLMYGDAGIAGMRSLKDLFDPRGMFNRGNLFPYCCV